MFLDFSESKPRRRRKDVIVCVWPRATVIPPLEDPGFEKWWALCQLRLHKPFRFPVKVQLPNITDIFFEHLERGGFPHLRKRKLDNKDLDNERQDDAGVSLMDNMERDALLQQDDYQFLMNLGDTAGTSLLLLGTREQDIIYMWPDTWNGLSFDFLHSWLDKLRSSTLVCPVPVTPFDVASFSKSQKKAFDIVYRHMFGTDQSRQLLMIVVGTAGTGKSFLINGIRQLFVQ